MHSIVTTIAVCQAIIGSRSPGYCTNPTFLSNYENCLQCAGPDNVNIWTFYGNSLTRAATSCGGLSTSPLSGPQEDVSVAIPAAGGSVTPSSSSASANSGPASTPTSSTASAPVPDATISETVATEAPASSSTDAHDASPDKTTTVQISSTTLSTTIASPGSSTVSASSGTITSSLPQESGLPGNYTGPAIVTGAARNLLPSAAAIFAIAAVAAIELCA
ncbi:hypothetical protein GLAREA_07886 [Glarea lozoyensis ATCC 20868]|uniref:Uncharacterized protein n=1 Tax=Glarea lozoyensis (strain ATCC 20868 / MF5171) TaxID=1116229 RepID=S3D2L4_GLAL2|nr:uncharacterized protein GLAREA_07886 [Glarea lozoyensis ATCC 20868]EPE32752.1 hypothetical protein GLAREA_07886 [Glarea lozoyensis ATCC 20868]